MNFDELFDEFFCKFSGNGSRHQFLEIFGPTRPLILTIKGGPVCDCEREHLKTCEGVQSRFSGIKYFDTLEQNYQEPKPSRTI